MTPERQALTEIAQQAREAEVSYGIDHKVPWARVGETVAPRTTASGRAAGGA